MIDVRLESVSKRFVRSSDAAAVDDVTLTIGAGEFFTLLGPSGCGKTTTLRMVAGFYFPTSGHIHFGAEDVTRWAPNKRDTGMVFQNYALFPHMSVAQNVAYGLKIRRVSRAEVARRVDEALAQVRPGRLGARRIDADSPAASSNAWRWPGPWSSGRVRCCWTSHCPIWMPSCARRPGWRSAASSARAAPPPST